MAKESLVQGTVVHSLVQAVRSAGAAGVGQPGGARSILWPDRHREWESVLKVVLELMPKLYVFGPYEPARRQGPSLWLVRVPEIMAT